MKRVLYLFLLIFSQIQANASHVAGYDLTLINIKNANGSPTDVYKWRMRFYRDVTGIAIPTTFTFNIYKNSDHQTVGNFTVNKINPQTFITKAITDCYPKSGNNLLELGIYESPGINYSALNSPNGYYVSCSHNARNPGIKNVLGSSENYAILFTMDFPRLNAGVSTRYNSSPEIKKLPFSRYHLGKVNTLDWSATDPDGDSLVYSLAQPLDNGTTKPTFLTIPYANGYNLFYNILDGNPDITINRNTGIVNFLPTQLGKYLIAIKIQEYRKISGVPTLIGEVRRELQIEIVNTIENSPILNNSIRPGFKTIVDTIDYDDTYSVNFSANDIDLDTLRLKIIPNQTPGEDIFDTTKFNVTWGNYKGYEARNLVIKSKTNVGANFTLVSNCSMARAQAYTFRVVVEDETCPTPLQDTILVKLFIQKKNNIIPNFTSPSNFNAPNQTIRYYLEVGKKFQLDADSLIKVYDADSSQNVIINAFPDLTNGVTFNNDLQFKQLDTSFQSKASLKIDLECKHIRSLPYKILIAAFDNNCPKPDTSYFRIELFVKERILLQENICAVSVDSLNTNHFIYWNTLNKSNIESYEIYSFNPDSNKFVFTANALNSGSNKIVLPITSYPNYASRYVIVAKDFCGTRSVKSIVHSAIYLTSTMLSNNHTELNWTNLEGATVSFYRVLKSENDSAFTLFKVLPGTVTSLIDSSALHSKTKYKVEVLRFDTCSSISPNNDMYSVYSNTVARINSGTNNSFKEKILVYPNPSSEFLNIQWMEGAESQDFVIYDVVGKEVFRDKLVERYNLPLANFASGVYTIKINGYLRKIIVNK